MFFAAGLLAACGGDPVPEEARPLPTGTMVTVSGHREVQVTEDGVIPRFQGDLTPGLCLQVPAAVDVSQWRGAVFLADTSPGPFTSPHVQPPTARVEHVVCFDLNTTPEPSGSTGDLEPRDLCGWVEDAYDGASYRLPCRSVLVEPENEAGEGVLQRAFQAVGERRQRPLAELFEILDRLAAEARDLDLPWLATRIDLIAVHYRIHEGSADDRRAAATTLGTLPAWTEQPAASALRADALYLAGLLELEDGALETAWEDFSTAEDLYRRSLEFNRLAAVNGQARVLIRVGAIRDGQLRLERALAGCADPDAPAPEEGTGAPCNTLTRLDARGMAAWMVLLDSTAGDDELAAAEAELQELYQEEVLEPQERANHLVNLALLRARRGQDPGIALARATALTDAADSRRTKQLASWGWMARALHHLSREDGDLNRAAQLCRGLAQEAPTVRLAAWSRSCLGRVAERRGDLQTAAWFLGQALQLHGRATPTRLGRLLPLGPEQRADDHYRAARVALKLGEPARAWDLLRALDHLEDAPSVQPAAGESSTGVPATLALEAPGDRRQALALLDSVALLDSEAPRNTAQALAPGAVGATPEYRAFALEDEIFLLHRRPTPPTRAAIIARRTSLEKGQLSRILATLQRAQHERDLDDRALRQLLRPLAPALWPTEALSTGKSEPRIILFALHGVLQKIPLDALPGPESSQGRRWLGEVAIPAARPARLDPPSGRPELAGATLAGSGSHPLIILDPTGDLGTRGEMRELYQRSFPAGRILVGEAARRGEILEALPSASWFHADTHGRFDPAFPEQSSLTLADGELSVRDLSALSVILGFANLSGCRTGQWPTSADSGRYGLAGQFARQGASWVIASRADLLNDLAQDFNPAFYRLLAAGTPVPLAWHGALARVRESHPAIAWSTLFLIRGPEPPGQSKVLTTPLSYE